MFRVAPKSSLAWLLHVANSSRGLGREFYDLKTRLLRRYATFRGHEMQEITKQCWGDKRDEYGDLYGCGPNCRRCGGTGIFDRRWVRLQRWEWGRYVFHVPDGDTRNAPCVVTIFGRIEHRDYGKGSREAELWLYLVTGSLKMLWHALTACSYCSPGWWPMCRLQKVAMWSRMRFSWQKCWCGKWFPTWGRGWRICRKCRKCRSQKPVDDDVPF